MGEISGFSAGEDVGRGEAGAGAGTWTMSLEMGPLVCPELDDGFFHGFVFGSEAPGAGDGFETVWREGVKVGSGG